MKDRRQSSRMHQVGFFQRNQRNRVIAEVLQACGYETSFANGEGVRKDIDLWIACLSDPLEAAAAKRLRQGDERIPLLALSGGYTREVDDLAETLCAQKLIDFKNGQGLRELVEELDDVLRSNPTKDDPQKGRKCLEHTYEANETGTYTCACDLAAFLMEIGVAHAHRIRIVSAVYEATDNVRRHAYPDRAGTFAVEVELERTQVHICVVDQGCGFDAARMQLDSVVAALPTRGHVRLAHPAPSGGLLRLAALSEKHEVQSDRNGTRVEMTFELTPVRFDEEFGDSTDVDFLDPPRSREIMQSLEAGEEIGAIAPAMALTVGRLLGKTQRGC